MLANAVVAILMQLRKWLAIIRYVPVSRFRCGEVKREETNRQKKKGDRMMPDAAFYFHFIDYP